MLGLPTKYAADTSSLKKEAQTSGFERDLVVSSKSIFDMQCFYSV